MELAIGLGALAGLVVFFLGYMCGLTNKTREYRHKCVGDIHTVQAPDTGEIYLFVELDSDKTPLSIWLHDEVVFKVKRDRNA